VAAALAFNARLGDPQRAFASIQVAGTSGKGTVCWTIARALHAAGHRTGLHVSPYLQAFTEKTWIDGLYLPGDELEAATDAVRPTAEAFRADDDCPASVHGLTSLAVSYEAFRRAGVQVAVVETGCGGRHDLVQGLNAHMGVITDLGLDHVQALGGTIESIALHKAGIMRPNVPCVAIRGAGWDVLAAEAERVGARLISVVPDRVVLESRREAGRTDVRLLLPSLGLVEARLQGTAPFLLRNAALAAVAIDALAPEWSLGRAHLRQALEGRPPPGRFEVVGEEPRVILDGAHNPHKLEALLAGLDPSERVVAVVAATGHRLPEDIVARLARRASLVIAAEPQLHGKSVVSAADLAAVARREGAPVARAVPSTAEAIALALDETPAGGTLLVTGSMYLVGEIRSRWFPWERVVLDRTSWPGR